MSIQQNFPAITPSLSLNFARSKTLDPRITFSRTTTATRVNEQGLVEVVSADIPRFDHEYDPVSGTVRSLGLLVEESRITYQTYTEDPSQWNTSNMVSTGNSVTLPTGEVSTTIEYKGETTDANNKFIRPTVSGSAITAGDTWTYSGFYKKGTTNGERYVHIVLQNNTAGEGIGRRFDFDNGNWASSLGLNNVTVADSGFEEYPNGWYRIWMTCTFPSAAGAVQTFTRLYANSTSIPYDTSFSLWGAQLEKASFYTSYIPNDTGSQKTRNPDSVRMEGENFSDWFNTDEGTLHMRISSTQGPQSGYPRLLMLTPAGQNSQNNSLQFIHANSSVGLSFALWQGGTIRRGYNKSVTGPEDKENIIFAYKSDGDTSVYVDGNSLTNTISATYAQPVFGRMGIGAYPGGEGTTPRTTIESLVYYPKRLTNTQLQNLTK